jgi:hypothetical protein
VVAASNQPQNEDSVKQKVSPIKNARDHIEADKGDYYPQLAGW